MAAALRLDGVRGVAGDLLTAELSVALGRAATAECEAQRPQVLLIRDTRESARRRNERSGGGIPSAGGDALIGGALPTPAASVLVRRLGLDLAAVISASHNPGDNGISSSAPTASFSLDVEHASRPRRARPPRAAARSAGRACLRAACTPSARASRATSRWTSPAGGWCSTARTARPTARRPRLHPAGADVVTTESIPTASTSTRAAARRIPRTSPSARPAAARVDRLLRSTATVCSIAVDSAGRVRDGDEAIALIATHLDGAGRLSGGVAVTVMSNDGFHQAMDEAGIEIATTAVGDRHVSAELERRDWSLGGEQSGHLIWTEFAPSGDGIAAALLLLAALGDRDLAATKPMERLPQVLVNIEVADRDAVEGATAVWEAIEREGAELEGRGRILVRPSGTEPLVRVMVEAPTETEAKAACGRLVEIVRSELG